MTVIRLLVWQRAHLRCQPEAGQHTCDCHSPRGAFQIQGRPFQRKDKQHLVHICDCGILQLTAPGEHLVHRCCNQTQQLPPQTRRSGYLHTNRTSLTGLDETQARLRMACLIEVTSQIIPVYPCYPHSVSNQDALLDLF